MKRGPVKINSRSNNDLKRGYKIRLQIGLILSLLVFIALAKVEINPPDETKIVASGDSEIVHMEEVIQTKQEIKIPPPPRPVIPVEVPNDEIITEEIIDLDAEINLDAPMELPPPPPQSDFGNEEEDDIFVVVEQMPQLIGGLAAVQKHIEYPQMALMAGIEGRVVVQFVIDEEGNVHNPVVVRGIGGGCDEEAVKAVQKVKFIPGKQRGKAVKVRYSLPISFTLKNANS